MEKMLKLLFFCLLLTAFYACEANKGSADLKIEHNRHLLVFIDKSQSVNDLPPAFSTLFEAQIGPILSKMIRTPGDKMEAYLIHGATVSNQKVLENVFKAMLPNKEGGPQDQEDAANKYKSDLERFHKRTSQDIINILEDKSIGDATLETDVLGSLELISNFISSIPKEDTAMVVYMSDMVHSQAAPRDYYKKPIKDLQDANACATADYNWLQSQRKINSDAFRNLKIHIIFPSGNYDMSQNDKMMYYWQALLGKINNSVQISRN